MTVKKYRLKNEKNLNKKKMTETVPEQPSPRVRKKPGDS